MGPKVQPLFKSVTGKIFHWWSGNPRIPATVGDTPVPERLPLIVFSHGYTATRLAYSTLLTEIASHGYYVAAIEHGDGSAGTRMLRGSPEEKIAWMDYNPPKSGKTPDEDGEHYGKQLNFRISE